MTVREKGYRTHRYVYGVSGLTEWQALITVGSAKVRIPFTGGSLSAYGQVPARFATCDPSVARLIEDSEYFKSRRIRRLE